MTLKMGPFPIEEWRYVYTIEDTYGLTIFLNDDGREELIRNVCQHGTKRHDHMFLELLEDMLGNGWENFHADDLGALSSCTICLAPEVWRREEDDPEYVGNHIEDITNIPDLFFHERYCIDDPVEVLLLTGKLWLQRAMED